MLKLKLSSIFSLCIAAFLYAQVEDFTCTDMDDSTYQLYELLDAGKVVVVHHTWSG